MNNRDLKFFLVDDDAICRELYQQCLKNLGYHDINLFSNGQDCINEITKRPDVVFLDHQMQPLDGMATLKKIKRFDPDIYLVFISGQSDMHVAIDALKYGAFDYLIKGDNEEANIEGVIARILRVSALQPPKKPGKASGFFSFLSL